MKKTQKRIIPKTKENHNKELSLNDFDPMPAELVLSSFPKMVFHLKKFTLRDRLWVTKEWGAEAVKEAFEKSDPEFMAKVTWRLLDEKDVFEDNFENFLEAIVGLGDMYNVQTALLTTVGLSEPVIKALQDPKIMAQLLHTTADNLAK